jgi:hypothetical protein
MYVDHFTVEHVTIQSASEASLADFQLFEQFLILSYTVSLILSSQFIALPVSFEILDTVKRKQTIERHPLLSLYPNFIFDGT